MPLSDTLKDLMNAGRNRLGSVNKLSIPDLIALLKDTPTDVRTINLIGDLNNNACNSEFPSGDTRRVIATKAFPDANANDGVGVYCYPGGSYPINWGSKYHVHVRALMRGNMRLVGFASNPVNIQLREDKWTEINTVYNCSACTFYGASTEAGQWFEIKNLEFIILGGLVPANLLANGHGPFLPQADSGANPYDNYVVYPDIKINMVYGKKYKLIAHTNGEFSKNHQPTVESDRCVLWLTNDKLSQIISDSNTSTGTIFTWGWDTDTYWLRVNAYHHGTSNHIQAWDISITEV